MAGWLVAETALWQWVRYKGLGEQAATVGFDRVDAYGDVMDMEMTLTVPRLGCWVCLYQWKQLGA